MKLTGNTILITGGTSGIGRALAEQFHQRGNKVIIAGRRQNLLDEVTSANPGMADIQLDVQDPAAIKAMVELVQKEFPNLNVLINNAGIAGIEDYTTDSVDTSLAETIVHTNITSVLRVTAQLLPILKKQSSSTIITTTSGLAFTPISPYPAYSASKAFLHSWLQSLRTQLRNTSIEILELAPPYVQTELGGPSQAVDPAAMPLKDFIDEVMQILETSTFHRHEILVERVKPLRFSEQNNAYEQTYNALNHLT